MWEADCRIMLSDGVCYEHVEDADLHHQVRELLGLSGESLFSFSFGSLWSQGKVNWGCKSHFAFSAMDIGFRHRQTVSVSTTFTTWAYAPLASTTPTPASTPGSCQAVICPFFCALWLRLTNIESLFLLRLFWGEEWTNDFFFLISVFSFWQECYGSWKIWGRARSQSWNHAKQTWDIFCKMGGRWGYLSCEIPSVRFISFVEFSWGQQRKLSFWGFVPFYFQTTICFSDFNIKHIVLVEETVFFFESSLLFLQMLDPSLLSQRLLSRSWL